MWRIQKSKMVSLWRDQTPGESSLPARSFLGYLLAIS
jgi:hypothetical protein